MSVSLDLQMQAMGIEFVAEHRFHPTRRWRFDYAIPSLMLAIEVEGGGWTGGRHTRGKGFANDLEKYDEAMRLGWNVYRCSPEMVRKGRAIQTILALIEVCKGNPRVCVQCEHENSPRARAFGG